MSEKNALIRKDEGAIRLSDMLPDRASSLLDDDVRDNSYMLGFNIDTQQGKAMLFAMETDATDKVEDYRDKPFPVKAWGCKRVPLYDDQSREYVPVIRIVLIAEDGRTLAMVSDGATASLDLIRMVYGSGPYEPPLPVFVREVKTRRGYRMYKLIPDGVMPTGGNKRNR